MEEQKRYRNSFILLTLIATAGILTGLYLYEYTDYFAALKADADILKPVPDLRELILLFFEELRLLFVIFLFGFTLFSPYLSVILVLYKGFMTGFSVLYLGLYYTGAQIDKPHFMLNAFSLILILTVYIITGAKAMAFSGSLRYAAPDLRGMLTRKSSSVYMITFLLLCAFLLMSMALKYMIPMIKL